MPRPLSFGIELEFVVAYVPNLTTDHPWPHEKRCTRFTPSDDDLKFCRIAWNIDRSRFISKEELEREYPSAVAMAYKECIHRALRETLGEAGFPTNLSKDDFDFKITKWGVKDDGSVDRPDCASKYNYVAAELVSPAYYYGDDAKETVRKVCNLLTNTYCINTNQSTGFHVHIGNGSDEFPFHTIRNLALFLWIFEPQLNMLHPETRQDSDPSYCKSMRRWAPFVEVFSEDLGEHPSVYQGALQILSCQDVEDLVKSICARRDSAYNFHGLSYKIVPYPKFTLEFRQHESTFDVDAVLNWLEVCHGIVDYIRHISAEEVHRLIQFSKLETWEETGDRKSDEEMEAKFGPVMAKGKFTVIDLLRFIKLNPQADYYSERVQKQIKWSLSGGGAREGANESPDFNAAEDFFDQFLPGPSDTSKEKNESTETSEW